MPSFYNNNKLYYQVKKNPLSLLRNPFSFLRNFIPFVANCSFINSKKQENVAISTTPNYFTLVADSVQWLSQSDYSISISILVEFY